MLKVVIDTNVFVSGLYWKGNYSCQVIDSWKNKNFLLVTSQAIIEELTRILKTFRIKTTEEEIEKLKEEIIKKSIIVEPLFTIDIVKDKSDNKFIEAAYEVKADYIVTQDNDLLSLKEYQGIKIITPNGFLRVMG